MSLIDDPIDEDIRAQSREQLIDEVKKLRRGIRQHRDSTKHELGWHHPALWGLLPERTDPLPAAETHEDAILWRRLDVPGHDACRLVRQHRGWRVEGAASFRDDDGPAWLAYQVECDVSWSARRGWVRGHLGPRAVDFEIAHVDGTWQVNRTPIDGLAECMDLDLGFTPATNVIHIRRLALKRGQAGDVRSAWFDVPTGSLKPLDQRYEKRSESAYWYQAPMFGYAAELDVAASGFIRRYPTLWEEEPAAT